MGRKRTIPITIEARAEINTMPAERSLTILALFDFLGLTMSTNFSITVFINSKVITVAIVITKIANSIFVNFKKNEAIIVITPTVICTLKLGSFLKASLMPSLA